MRTAASGLSEAAPKNYIRKFSYKWQTRKKNCKYGLTKFFFGCRMRFVKAKTSFEELLQKLSLPFALGSIEQNGKEK
jgi:hypothetical protein